MERMRQGIEQRKSYLIAFNLIDSCIEYLQVFTSLNMVFKTVHFLTWKFSLVFLYLLFKE